MTWRIRGWASEPLRVTTRLLRGHRQVEDLSSSISAAGIDVRPTALSVLLFDGAIPSDRLTEHASTVASGDGLYSVAVSAHDIHAGASFVRSFVRAL